MTSSRYMHSKKELISFELNTGKSTFVTQKEINSCNKIKTMVVESTMQTYVNLNEPFIIYTHANDPIVEGIVTLDGKSFHVLQKNKTMPK